jgi:branched-chain amino acid transport system substrate-binding protein
MNRSIGIRHGRNRARLTAVAASAVLALVASGCGAGGGGGASGSTPGVTKDTIKLGTTQPLTGPAAPGYSPISRAMDAYFKYINEEGGINGRKIDLIIEDDGYNPTQTAAKTRKLVLQDKVFAIASGLGTPTKTAVLDFIRQNKVPDLMVSSGSLSWNQPDKAPYTFGWQTDYVREGKILASYAKEKFAGKKFCSFGQGDDLGADGVKGVETILGKDGLASKQSYTVSNTNVAPQIGQLQAAGCQVIFSFSIPGFNALALGTAAKLGYKAQWVASSVGGDPAALKGYLKDAAAPLTQGLIAGNYLPLIAEDNSWIKLFTKIHAKYYPGKPLDFTSLHGYSVAYTIAQALKAAGKNPTRESLVKAIEDGSIKGGPIPTPYAYSEKDHSGMTGLYITQLDKLEPKALGLYTTDGGDGPVEAYTAEASEAPADGIPQ